MKILKKLYTKLTGQKQDWANKALQRYPFSEPNERYNLQQIARRLLETSGGEVFTGPLAGLKIPPESSLANVPMYVIGCYEQEIHGVLSEVICDPPEQMIDIGSAHGYYMVGMAVQMPNSRVIGFEAEQKDHWDQANQLAALNGVSDRVIQKGLCTCEALESTLEQGDFILCDCEGAERELLDPQKVPALRTCRILCEIHDFIYPETTGFLVDRFRTSHDIKLIVEEPRNPAQFRILNTLSAAEKRLVVTESKHVGQRITPTRFLDFRPRN